MPTEDPGYKSSKWYIAWLGFIVLVCVLIVVGVILYAG
jgi:hypothetical protein